ncbi:MAG: NUDIX domain-containing protein, partial [Candidatus Saccharibacteria bacterium]|nr:NUDIX domain-containing protein [Candidatus Saccharibacteria bacterium]
PMSKNHYPGRWDITACGGVVNGQDDSPLEAAVRETAEETGIDGIDLVFVEEFLNEFPGDNGENRRRWSSLFIGITDIKPVANGIEVVQFQSGYPYELREDATTNPDNYVPSFVFEIEKAERAYQNQTL